VGAAHDVTNSAATSLVATTARYAAGCPMTPVSALAVARLHPTARVSRILSLQRHVGNRAVGAVLATAVQRSCGCGTCPECKPAGGDQSVQRDDAAAPTLGNATGDPTQLNGGATGKKSWTKFDVKPTVYSPSYSDATYDPVYKAVDALVTGGGEAGHETSARAVDTDLDASGNVTDARVTYTLEVTLPQWTNVGSQCAAVKNAWNGMLTPLTQHEQNHVNRDKKNLAGAHTKMVGKSAADATTALTAVEAAGDADQQAYDTASDHGKNEGVVLNFANCTPEKVQSGGTGSGSTPTPQ
jgi:hypothetical protein